MNQEKNSVETANDVVDTLIRETDAIFGKVERIEIFGEAEVLPEDDWMDKRSGGVLSCVLFIKDVCN